MMRRVRGAVERGLRSALDPSTAPLWIAVVVALGIALPFIAFGGLGPAQRTSAQASAGEQVRTSLYAVTILSAELVDEVEEQYLEAEPGDRLLVVTLELENLSTVPVGILQTVDGVRSRLVSSSTPLLDLSGGTASDDPAVWRDGSLAAVVLQPRVPAEVRIAWPVPADSFPDGTAMLDVYDAEPRAGQVIQSSSAITWRRTEMAAQVSVEVSP